MLTLKVKVRQNLGRKTKALRKKGLLPAIIYGPKIKALPLEVDYREFEKVYKEAGESSLISLEIENQKPTLPTQQKSPVLIHEVALDPLTGKFLHIDFYQVPLTEEVEAKVPLVFEGEAKAVKELGGTLIKNILELEVKALPQNLPKEIRVDLTLLKNFEDHILIKDLKLPKEIKILKDPEEIVALITSPEKVEEELEKPIEEKIEEVAKVEKEKKKEENV